MPLEKFEKPPIPPEQRESKEKVGKEPEEIEFEEKEIKRGPEKVPETEGERLERLKVEQRAEEERRKTEIEKARKEIERLQREREEVERKEVERRQAKARIELIRESVDIPEEYKTLVGDNSEEAWKKREELIKKGGRENWRIAIRSLAGVASEKSRELLNKLYLTGLASEKSGKWLSKYYNKIQPFWASIAEGLKGDDSEEAHKIREWLYFAESVGRVRGERVERIMKVIMRLFLIHPYSERFYRFRKWVDRWSPLGWLCSGDLAESLLGCTSKKAIEWRERLRERDPVGVLISLTGIDEAWAHKMRKELLEKYGKVIEWAYKRSLKGIEVKE